MPVVLKLAGVCGNCWEVCVGIAGRCVWELSQVVRAVERGVYQIRGLRLRISAAEPCRQAEYNGQRDAQHDAQVGAQAQLGQSRRRDLQRAEGTRD